MINTPYTTSILENIDGVVYMIEFYHGLVSQFSFMDVCDLVFLIKTVYEAWAGCTFQNAFDMVMDMENMSWDLVDSLSWEGRLCIDVVLTLGMLIAFVKISKEP
jgi:hypothetical protein